MKLPLSLLLFVCLTWMGCGDDDDTAVVTTLNYDGPNVTAPSSPPGTSVFAAYFPASETAPFQGRTLERIRFWLSDIPQSTVVYVFDEGPDDRTPGAELYRKDVTARVTTTGWYEDRLLSDALILGGSGLWLAVEVDLATGQEFSVGCDAGRTYDPNGDLLLWPTNTQWASFGQITGGGERVNWNIRGVLNEAD